MSGIRNDARLNTVSGDIIVDGLTGDLTVNAVSGDVQVRELVGALSANSVSGDVAATGALRKATIDTVSGAMLVDSTGDLHSVALNTVSGSTTIRLDEGFPANYVIRSVSGRVQVDGVKRSGTGTGPTTNYVARSASSAAAFADIRANSVSGGVTVLRRAIASQDAASRDASAGSRLRRRRAGVVMSPVFSHGDLRLYLLNLLDEGPRHGYDIMQALSDRTGGTYTPSAGTVYPRLAKLEEEGLVTKSVDGRKTVYEITPAGHAEVAARAGDLEGIEASLTDSVRLIADEVRGSVREAMRSLRADLAAASREERTNATPPPASDDPRMQQSRAGAPGGCRGQRVPREDPQRPALARRTRRRARRGDDRRAHVRARSPLARPDPDAARLTPSDVDPLEPRGSSGSSSSSGVVVGHAGQPSGRPDLLVVRHRLAERHDQDRAVLAMCEPSGDRTGEELADGLAESALAGADDEQLGVDLIGEVLEGQRRVSDELPNAPVDPWPSSVARRLRLDDREIALARPRCSRRSARSARSRPGLRR